MRLLMFGLIAALFASAAPSYADQAEADRLAATVAPYLDEFTVAVVHADLAKIDLAAAWSALPREAMDPALDKSRREIDEKLDHLRSIGVREIYGVLSLDGTNFLSGQGRRDLGFFVIPLSSGAEPGRIAKAFDKNSAVGKPPVNDNVMAARVKDGVLLIGRRGTLDRLEKLEPVSRPELAKALASVEPAAVRVALLPPSSFGRVVSEMRMPELPGVGRDWGKSLARGFVWAAVGVRSSDKQIGARLVIQSEDAAAAGQLLNLIKQAASWFAQSSIGSASLRESMSDLLPEIQEDRLILQIDQDHVAPQRIFAMLSEPLRIARQDAIRNSKTNSMKQILLAMHQYYDVHKRLPASSTYDDRGRPRLSWRVHILPYIDQQALYKRFHLDEPWDSEHNKALIPLMPGIYGEPGQADKGTKTACQVPIGEGTLFDSKEGRTFKEVVDGTSKTIMLVVVKPELAVTWTKPEDWQFKHDDPTRGLADYRGQFLTGFADGSARGIKTSTDKEMLRRLFIRNDRMPVELDR